MKKWVLSDRRNDASLFPVVYFESGCGESSSMHKSLGVSLASMVNAFEGPVWSYYEEPGDWKRVGTELSAKVKSDPDFVANAINQTYRLGARLLELTGRVSTADLRKSTNVQLADYLDEYGLRLKEMRGWAWIAPALDASGVFSKMLDEILAHRLKSLGRESESAVFFASLTSPEKRTLGKQQDIDLLKIAAKVKADPEAAKLFLENSDDEIIGSLSSTPQFGEFNRMLLEHTAKYCWLPCTYEGQPWNLRYFASILSGLLKEGANPEADLLVMLSKEKNAQDARKTAALDLRLSQDEIRLFDTAADLLFFKADRKDIFFRSYYEMRPLILEISRRLEITEADARKLLPQEMKDALLQGTLDRTELASREEFYAAIMENGATRVLCGDAGRKFITDNCEEPKVGESVSQLRGSCASPGYAKGTVKLILSPRDMHKMNPGDILVANATNPDIVPAMKKAAAIVTNTGGITCHAAIVSRELGIPCVVGTKVATEVLNDGEIVEVDATGGVVRRTG